ncbi:MAG: iron ABC transporter permease [Ilumatobacteraceae bacterium]
MSQTLRTVATPGAASLRRPVGVRLGWLLAILAVLAVLVMASVAFGTRQVGVDEIVGGLFGTERGDAIGRAAVTKRVPRTVLALLVGAALSVSGATMQAVTRNPLAEPGILGVSAGASLAVAMGIVFFGLSDPYEYIVVAIAGAAIASVFVYCVGSLGRGGATPLKLALAGAAMAAAFSSLLSAILLPRVDLISNFLFWQVGGVGGATWDRIGVLVPFLALGVLICLANARGMNSLALGDDLAAGLGANVARVRLASAVGAVLLCGAATAIAGPIAFVGLVVPHVCRLLVGSDHHWLLPFSALGGAALLVAADVVGRVIARPAEIEVGIITAVIGAPVLIWVVRHQKLREL